MIIKSVPLTKDELNILRSAMSDYQASSKRSYQSKLLLTKISEFTMEAILEDLAAKKSVTDD